MLEARLQQASTLKKLLDAIKELVTDANFECNEEGINLQAMDNSHVALVSVKLSSSGFQKYRCDRPMPLGVNLGSLGKVLKCAKDDDICTLTATDDADVLSLKYESRNEDRLAEYDMKLMEIESDTLGIPDTDYDARVFMPSSELSRIVRDMSQLGESVRIEVTKEGVRFNSDGEAANGSVLLKQTEASRKYYTKKLELDEDSDEEEEKKEKKEKKVKKEKDDDVSMNGEEGDDEEFKAKSDDEGEEEQDGDDDDEGASKKRKKKASSSKPAKKARKSKKRGDDSDDEGGDGRSGVMITLNQAVNLTFSLKYLVNFSKSASLSDTVHLMMSNDVPLLVEYNFEQGMIQYYLAPKIGDE